MKRKSVFGDRPSEKAMTLAMMPTSQVAAMLRVVASDVSAYSPEDRRHLLGLAADRLDRNKRNEPNTEGGTE